MTSEPIKDFGEGLGKGVTKGLLEYSESKIKELIGLFRDKKLKFIGDEYTIQVAKETRDSGEWKFYKAYIKDDEMLFIIKMGLVLRKLEKNQDKLNNLRERIRRKYNVKGLHIAYFVQNGILNRYVAILLDDLSSTENLEKTIVDTLSNIEKHAIFVDWRYEPGQLLKEVMTVTASHKPSIFVVSGIASASKIVKDISENLIQNLSGYVHETMSTGKKEILFFKYQIDKRE
jgi:hypothetical protein